jgi:predicted dienelactone hydrolase
MHTTPAVPVVSVRPVRLNAPGRGTDLTVRVTAPTIGTGLPVVVLSHGYHQSERGYDPLVDAWAQHFVVVQPTHLDSAALNLPADDPRTPDIWRIRVDDLSRVIDQLDTALAAVPGLAGRADPACVGLAGHSWGGQSVGMLLGARVLDAHGTPGESLRDPRVSAGVLLTTTGTGESLTPFAAENFAFMRPDFSGLTTPTLVVAGDADQSMLSTRGPDWFLDPYLLSPGATDLLTVASGEHSLGGITGYGVTETTDEDQGRAAMVAQVTTAWLRGSLLGHDIQPEPGQLGTLTSK